MTNHKLRKRPYFQFFTFLVLGILGDLAVFFSFVILSRLLDGGGGRACVSVCVICNLLPFSFRFSIIGVSGAAALLYRSVMLS